MTLRPQLVSLGSKETRDDDSLLPDCLERKEECGCGEDMTQGKGAYEWQQKREKRVNFLEFLLLALSIYSAVAEIVMNCFCMISGDSRDL